MLATFQISREGNNVEVESGEETLTCVAVWFWRKRRANDGGTAKAAADWEERVTS